VVHFVEVGYCARQSMSAKFVEKQTAAVRQRPAARPSRAPVCPYQVADVPLLQYNDRLTRSTEVDPVTPGPHSTEGRKRARPSGDTPAAKRAASEMSHVTAAAAPHQRCGTRWARDRPPQTDPAPLSEAWRSEGRNRVLEQQLQPLTSGSHGWWAPPRAGACQQDPTGDPVPHPRGESCSVETACLIEGEPGYVSDDEVDCAT
jgi:hypothetical protein